MQVSFGLAHRCVCSAARETGRPAGDPPAITTNCNSLTPGGIDFLFDAGMGRPWISRWPLMRPEPEMIRPPMCAQALFRTLHRRFLDTEKLDHPGAKDHCSKTALAGYARRLDALAPNPTSTELWHANLTMIAKPNAAIARHFKMLPPMRRGAGRPRPRPIPYSPVPWPLSPSSPSRKSQFPPAQTASESTPGYTAPQEPPPSSAAHSAWPCTPPSTPRTGVPKEGPWSLGWRAEA